MYSLRLGDSKLESQTITHILEYFEHHFFMPVPRITQCRFERNHDEPRSLPTDALSHYLSLPSLPLQRPQSSHQTAG